MMNNRAWPLIFVAIGGMLTSQSVMAGCSAATGSFYVNEVNTKGNWVEIYAKTPSNITNWSLKSCSVEEVKVKGVSTWKDVCEIENFSYSEAADGPFKVLDFALAMHDKAKDYLLMDSAGAVVDYFRVGMEIASYPLQLADATACGLNTACNIIDQGNAGQRDFARVPDGSCTWVEDSQSKDTRDTSNSGVGDGTTAPSGFNVFDVAASNYIKTKLAGAAFSLDVAAIGAGTFSGNVKLELLANTGTPGSGYGADNCPTSATVIQTLASTAIAGGRSTASFAAVPEAYRDVRVRVTYTGVTPSIIACSTDSFAIRPASFTLVGKDTDPQTAGTARTLDNTAASGGTVHKAGQPFTFAAAAYNAAATPAVTTNYAGTPTQTLSACSGTACTASFGSFVPGVSNFSSGLITSNTATYSEVGAFALALQDTTFASIDVGDGTPADCSGRYICSSATAVGRFVPDHFKLTASSITPAISGSFSYMDQPFRVTLTLEAQNSSSVKTLNYAGVLAPGVLAFAAENANDGVNLLATRMTGLTTTTWSSGAYDVDATAVKFSRLSASPYLDGPYESLALGVKVTDPDGPVLQLLDTNPVTGSADTTCLGATTTGCTFKTIGTTKIRFGRLRLSNTFGSVSPLKMPVETQYWSGNSWIKNTDDTGASGTPVATIPLTLAPTGWTLALPASLSSGAGQISITPDSNETRTLTANLDDLPWLKSRWGGTAYDQSPSAKATFGIYAPETRKTIHVR